MSRLGVSPNNMSESVLQDFRSPGYAWFIICLVSYAGFVLVIAGQDFISTFGRYLSTLAIHLGLILAPVCAIGIFFRIHTYGISNSLEFLRCRLPLLAFATVGMLLVFSAYTTIKIMIPELVPFHADQWAAHVDVRLHGVVPWQWAHAVWPEAWSNVLLFIYARFWFVYWIATPFYVVLWFRSELARQYLWVFLLVFIICGNVLAVVFSSVGPIFHDHFIPGTTFEALEPSLRNLEGANFVLAPANYLLGSYHNQDNAFGTGISAIPSMHVAVVVLNAWLFSQVNRIAGTLAWAFALLIQFGSVYTGWHYAIDGYLSAIVVTAIWAGVQRVDRSAWSWNRQRQARA